MSVHYLNGSLVASPALDGIILYEVASRSSISDDAVKISEILKALGDQSWLHGQNNAYVRNLINRMKGQGKLSSSGHGKLSLGITKMTLKEIARAEQILYAELRNQGGVIDRDLAAASISDLAPLSSVLDFSCRFSSEGSAVILSPIEMRTTPYLGPRLRHDISVGFADEIRNNPNFLEQEIADFALIVGSTIRHVAKLRPGLILADGQGMVPALAEWALAYAEFTGSSQPGKVLLERLLDGDPQAYLTMPLSVLTAVANALRVDRVELSRGMIAPRRAIPKSGWHKFI